MAQQLARLAPSPGYAAAPSKALYLLAGSSWLRQDQGSAATRSTLLSRFADIPLEFVLLFHLI